jgi:glycosyltransferase involved in cell wall biosynthesis
MKKQSKKTLAVVRGFYLRPHEAFFYSYIRKFKVKFICNEVKRQNYSIRTGANTEFISLPLEPIFRIDPVRFLKRARHRTWARLRGLEEHLGAAEIINSYETSHFFSRQCADFAKKTRKPLIIDSWMNITNHLTKFLPPYSFNVKKVAEVSDFFVLRNQKAADYVLSFGVSPRKMAMIYMGIDLSRFKPLKQESDKVRILFVGQLVESKGVNDLLTAFSQLTRNFSNLELWVAGKGPLEREVKKLSQEYPVRYLGFVSYRELPRIYQKVDIFCSPSKELKYLGLKIWEEIFSYTLMEAQACGLPIVATKCGGIPEEIGSDNLLVKQNDIVGLYK